MGAIIVYLLKSALVLSLLYIAWRFALRRETFHTLNRTVLLSILAASLLLPVCRFSTAPTAVSERMGQAERTILMADAAQSRVVYVESLADVQATAEAAAPAAPSRSFSLSWTTLIAVVYAIGVVVAFGHYLFLLCRLHWCLRRKGGWHIGRGVRLLRDEEMSGSPFNWGRHVVMSRADFAQGGRPMLAHEFAHVRLCHTLDLLFCEAVVRLQWFNPLAWQLLGDLRTIHEYQADRAAMRHGFPLQKDRPAAQLEAYGLLILRRAAALSGVRLAGLGFARGSLRRRLCMMRTSPSGPWRALRLLLILPLLCFILQAYSYTGAAPGDDQFAAMQVDTAYAEDYPAAMQVDTVDATNYPAAMQVDTAYAPNYSADMQVDTAYVPNSPTEMQVDTAGTVEPVYSDTYVFTSDGYLTVSRLGGASFTLPRLESVAGKFLLYLDGRLVSDEEMARRYGNGKAGLERLFGSALWHLVAYGGHTPTDGVKTDCLVFTAPAYGPRTLHLFYVTQRFADIKVSENGHVRTFGQLIADITALGECDWDTVGS